MEHSCIHIFCGIRWRCVRGGLCGGMGGCGGLSGALDRRLLLLRPQCERVWVSVAEFFSALLGYVGALTRLEWNIVYNKAILRAAGSVRQSHRASFGRALEDISAVHDLDREFCERPKRVPFNARRAPAESARPPEEHLAIGFGTCDRLHGQQVERGLRLAGEVVGV